MGLALPCHVCGQGGDMTCSLGRPQSTIAHRTSSKSTRDHCAGIAATLSSLIAESQGRARVLCMLIPGCCALEGSQGISTLVGAVHAALAYLQCPRAPTTESMTGGFPPQKANTCVLCSTPVSASIMMCSLRPDRVLCLPCFMKTEKPRSAGFVFEKDFIYFHQPKIQTKHAEWAARRFRCALVTRETGF